MKFQWKQNGLALISALIWGTAFVAQDLCAGKIGPFFFNAARSAIAVAVLGVFLLIRRGVQKKRGTVQKGTGKHFWLGSLICGFLLSIAANLQQFGITDSGAGKASFLTALYVVLVPLIGRIFGKKNGINVWLGVVAAAAGMYFLCIKGDFTVATGDLFLIACAVAFALQVIAVDHFIEKVDGISLSWGQFLFTMIFSGIFTLIFDAPPTPEVLGECLIPILYVGLFSRFFPWNRCSAWWRGRCFCGKCWRCGNTWGAFSCLGAWSWRKFPSQRKPFGVDRPCFSKYKPLCG